MAGPSFPLHRSIYPLRVLGMGLGGVAIAAVLHEQQAEAWKWWLLGLSCVLWPHLALLVARASADPKRAEQRNLIVDSAIAGAWAPLMSFCLLPSVLLILITTYDKFSTGIRGLWWKSLIATGVAFGLFALVLRPVPAWGASFLIEVAVLPLVMLHTLAVGLGSYALIRKISRQNRELEYLRRSDVHTGLYSRDYWMQQAESVFARFREQAQPASLLLLDIDHFKRINDGHGHSVGDDVIRLVGQAILHCVRAQDCAGRYGGDEFAILCPGSDHETAQAVAQRIHAAVGAARLRQHPELRIGVSIGVAGVRTRFGALRDWIDAADKELYRAKQAGRNRVASAPATTSPSALHH